MGRPCGCGADGGRRWWGCPPDSPQSHRSVGRGRMRLRGPWGREPQPVTEGRGWTRRDACYASKGRSCGLSKMRKGGSMARQHASQIGGGSEIYGPRCVLQELGWSIEALAKTPLFGLHLRQLAPRQAGSQQPRTPLHGPPYISRRETLNVAVDHPLPTDHPLRSCLACDPRPIHPRTRLTSLDFS